MQEQKEVLCSVKELSAELPDAIKELVSTFKGGIMRISILVIANDDGGFISVYGKGNALATITSERFIAHKGVSK